MHTHMLCAYNKFCLQLRKNILNASLESAAVGRHNILQTEFAEQQFLQDINFHISMVQLFSCHATYTSSPL